MINIQPRTQRCILSITTSKIEIASCLVSWLSVGVQVLLKMPSIMYCPVDWPPETSWNKAIFLRKKIKKNRPIKISKTMLMKVPAITWRVPKSPPEAFVNFAAIVLRLSLSSSARANCVVKADRTGNSLSFCSNSLTSWRIQLT